MKIFLRQIPEAGWQFEETVAATDIDFPPELSEGITQWAVRCDARIVGDELSMAFEVEGAYTLNCARCLEDFKEKRTDRFELFFDIDPATEFIDYTQEFRDELVMVFPMSPHCREDCRGMCSGCGVNLNKEECKCINGDKEIGRYGDTKK